MQRLLSLRNLFNREGLALLTGLALLLAACGEAPTAVPGETAVADSAPTSGQAERDATAPTATLPPTPLPASPTPQLAALVNGQPIVLSVYEKELARFELAQEELGLAPEPGYRTQVLDALIERELMRQAAVVEGIAVAPEDVEAQLAALRSENADFEAWLADNLYTQEEFRQALALEMLAEQMVTIVTAEVPEAMEQVRARYIQLDDRQQAQALLAQIEAGADFAELAAQYSLDQVAAQNGGDLGFFAPGTLLVPEVETAAFNIQPGEVSEVISATNPFSGEPAYFLVQTLERDPQRPLTADVRHAFLQQKFQTWLAQQWENATVLRMVED